MNMQLIGYVQNREHWCWAVACKMVGEQYKRMHKEYDFKLVNETSPACGQVTSAQYDSGVVTKDMIGINWKIQRGGEVRVDAWQRAIVMNANTSMYQGYEGDVSGDDEAKSRGIKYYLTGNIHSSRIEVECIGSYYDNQSFMEEHESRIMKSMQRNEYIIGNAVWKEKKECHSLVITCIEENQVMLYDPLDGSILYCGIKEAFYSGFQSSMGVGVIKWIQRII